MKRSKRLHNLCLESFYDENVPIPVEPIEAAVESSKTVSPLLTNEINDAVGPDSSTSTDVSLPNATSTDSESSSVNTSLPMVKLNVYPLINVDAINIGTRFFNPRTATHYIMCDDGVIRALDVDSEEPVPMDEAATEAVPLTDNDVASESAPLIPNEKTGVASRFTDKCNYTDVERQLVELMGDDSPFSSFVYE